MSQEKKVTPKKNPFIPEELRVHLMEQLTSLGVNPAEMSDDEMIRKVSDLMKEESEKRLKLETEKAIMPLNAYCNGTHLKNKELLERLFKMNVPKVFLPIFEDEDINLNDSKIWEMVRNSGIRQIEDIKEIHRKRYVTIRNQDNSRIEEMRRERARTRMYK